MILPDGQTASLLAERRREVLIPVSSSEFGVVGSGVEQNDGNGSSMSKSGLWNLLWDGITFKKARKYATRPNHVTDLT